MRNKKKAFLSCAMVAGVMLAAAGAMAQTPPSPSGMCYAGAYKVEAFGPNFVTCPNPGSNGEECTTIEYKVTGVPSNVATVVSSLTTDPTYNTKSIVLVEGGANGNLNFFPCEGDSVTNLGIGSCHEETARINPAGSFQSFKITVKGKREAAPKSVVTKKGNAIGKCEIIGIGEVGTAVRNPFETVLRTETLRFKGCAVTFDYDLATGEVVSAALNTVESTKPACSGNGNVRPCCDFDSQDISKLELFLDNQPLGTGKFGSGYVSSGTNSCTTRVIGGRVYTWGDPCPEY